MGYGDGQFKTPSGIAVDSSGKIYVVDSSIDRVEVFSALPNIIAESKSVDDETSSKITSVSNKSSTNQTEISKVMNFTKSTPVVIPVWIKNNAKWWSQGELGDDDFVKGIQYMITGGIIKV